MYNVTSFYEGVDQLAKLRHEVWLISNKTGKLPPGTPYQKIVLHTDTFEYLDTKEKTILLFWMQDYSSIFEGIKKGQDYHNFNFVKKESKKPAFKMLSVYGSDSLLPSLIMLSSIKEKELIEQIQHSALSNEEKDFLHIYLTSILAYNNLAGFHADSIVNMSGRYIDKYPASVYNDYINENIRPDYTLSRFGIGGGFYSGYAFTMGNFNKYFTSGVPMGANIDVAYNRCIFMINLFSIPSVVKKHFIPLERTTANDTVTWGKGLFSSMSVASASLGVVVLNTYRFKIVPFGGVGTMGISAAKNEFNTNIMDKEEVLNMNLTPSYYTGINCEYKFKYIRSYTNYSEAFKSKLNKTYWYLKCMFAYVRQPDYIIKPEMRGSTLMFNVGIGTFSNVAVRKKLSNTKPLK